MTIRLTHKNKLRQQTTGKLERIRLEKVAVPRGQVLLSQNNNVHQRSKGSNINCISCQIIKNNKCQNLETPKSIMLMLLKDFSPNKWQHGVQRTLTLWENRAFHSRAALLCALFPRLSRTGHLLVKIFLGHNLGQTWSLALAVFCRLFHSGAVDSCTSQGDHSATMRGWADTPKGGQALRRRSV